MQIVEKKEIKKQKKREKIIDAAAELFSHKSYHEVMMEDVAKLISVAKGTVYNYFSSKEELYFSIIQLRMEKLIASLKEKIESEESSLDSLRSFTTHLYMFMMKYRNFFLIYQKGSLNNDNVFSVDLAALEKQLADIITGIVVRGKADGVFRNVDEKFTVSLILGSVYGAVQRGIENKIGDENKIIERDKVFEFVLQGLYAGFNNISVLPLMGKSIVITRTIEQSKETGTALKKLGANVIVYPTLEISPPVSWEKFDDIVLLPDKIDFIVFTSAHAVKMFNIRCDELNVQLNFNKTKVVSVGTKTSSVCGKDNIPVHIVPKKFSAEGVVEELSKYNLKNKVVFIPRSAIGREELPHGLKDLGAVIKSVPVYNVSLPSKENIKPYIEELKKSKPDLFIFTSPSTFENFLQIEKVSNPVNYFSKFDVAAIGPTTKARIEKKKVTVNIMPDEYTIDGLIKKIINYYSNKKK
ncbi:MAG: TetR family transcriptional regulator [Ignavibacteriaceae bacterium]|nr:TetR family transcriptional regulator [Ignavibacteriaceae bacterium]